MNTTNKDKQFAMRPIALLVGLLVTASPAMAAPPDTTPGAGTPAQSGEGPTNQSQSRSGETVGSPVAPATVDGNAPANRSAAADRADGFRAAVPGD